MTFIQALKPWGGAPLLCYSWIGGLIVTIALAYIFFIALVRLVRLPSQE
jgi:hypothetical protein